MKEFVPKCADTVRMEIELVGRTVTLEIRRRKGTRHMRLSLDHHNRVVVSAPTRCSEKAILGFIDARHDWLSAQYAKVPASRTLLDWLQEHPRISGSGDVFSVRIEMDTQRTRADYRFDFGGAELVLHLPKRGDDQEAQLLQIVRRFAKDALICRVAYHAKRLGLSFERVSVRDQSSRWGSCSSRGAISLNWRLVLLEPALQDYVILHELAHLTEMNHSARFWDLLDTYDSGRAEHEAQLDACCAALMRVGRSI